MRAGELLGLVDDLLALERREAAELELEDGAGLQLVDVEQVDEAVAGLFDRGRAADEGDDLVERVERLEVAAQDVHARLGLAEEVLGATHDDFDLVVDPVRDEAVDRERAGHAVDDREHVRAEVLLQLRVLVEVVQHDLRDRVALQHDHEALAGAAGGLVADVGDAADPAVLHEVGDLDREVVGVHLVRQLGDDEAGATLQLLDRDDRAHRDRTATRAVGVVDALDAEDLRAGREVGALDALDERFLQLLARGLGVLEVPLGAGCHFAQVVRRDVRRHAHGDADRAVDEEVREPRRQDRRLLRVAVVVVLEVDGVLLDVAHHLERERSHLRLGVPRGGRAVVAGRAEVALAERERVAQAPRLHEAHERVVDRRVAVRVELAHDVADDARALRERLVGAVAAVVHRVDHAAVHGLEAVAHVGQRTAHDDAHRVVEVRPLHLELQVDLVDLAVDAGALVVVVAGVQNIRCQGNARPSRSSG